MPLLIQLTLARRPHSPCNPRLRTKRRPFDAFPLCLAKKIRSTITRVLQGLADAAMGALFKGYVFAHRWFSFVQRRTLNEYESSNGVQAV
jgi:hypothetical protein